MKGLEEGRTYQYLTDAQADLIANLVNARFTADDPRREALRAQFRAIRCNADVTTMIEAVKPFPLLRTARPTAISEPGYYRNPETGELYRLAERKEGLRVLVYSKTGGPRRLDVAGNLVKGKWLEKGKFDSAKLRYQIKPEWLIDEKGLLEFAYGFCPLHGGPLVDGVSVALGYGPKCAEREGLPHNEEAARAVLVAQGIDADAFLAQHAAKAEG